MEAGHDAFLVVAHECSLGGNGRLGVLPAMTPVGKMVANRVRRHVKGSQQRHIVTDARYGGPVPVQAFLSHAQRRSATLDEFSAADQGRARWADRYFLLRAQFGNEGVPEYSSIRSDGGTLPVYRTNLSNEENQVASVSMTVSLRSRYVMYSCYL